MGNTLTVTTNHDFGADALTDITDIVFNTAGSTQANFLASQFDDTQISQSVHVTGDGNQNTIYVGLDATGTFSVETWTFTNFGTGGFLSIAGSGGDDTISAAGISVKVRIDGLGGADTMIGGSANDVFGFALTNLQPGEWIDGGDGTDEIILFANPNAYDFTVATILNVESLTISQAGGVTAVFTDQQFGAGGISQVRDSLTTTTKLVVQGSAVDLSGVTFTSWTPGTDTVDIMGTAGADSLTGSSQDDAIQSSGGNDILRGLAGNDILTGGKGKDSLGGGTGVDHFDFNSVKETKTGSKHDTITDFKHSEGDKIDLSTVDAKSGGGNQTFDFIGSHDFHEKKGELHYVKHGSYVLVEGDVNGDGHADFQIKVNGVGHLVGGDFVL